MEFSRSDIYVKKSIGLMYLLKIDVAYVLPSEEELKKLAEQKADQVLQEAEEAKYKEVEGDGDEGKEEEEEPVFASAEDLKKAEESAEEMIPVDPSDTPRQRAAKKKAFITQSKAMGFTFPGINPKKV